MKENKMGWRKEREKRKENRSELFNTIFDFGIVLIALYIFISLGSLIQKAAGEDIQYIAFWHAPWQWLTILLGVVL